MTGIVWAHAGPTMLAAFLASMVEFVEALTIVLAVGNVRGWRDTLFGTVLALGLLGLLVTTLGNALTRIPLGLVHLVIGFLLLMFGMRWLRKAVLRSAGVIPLHDEDTAFANKTEEMHGKCISRGWDLVAFGAAFQVTMLEGIEVVFIVIAVGASGEGLMRPASAGALAALLFVAAAGLVVHRPLARVPENGLKFAVGVLLSAFGCFWLGEGIGLNWPGDNWSALALVAWFLAIAVLTVPLCRARHVRVRSV